MNTSNAYKLVTLLLLFAFLSCGFVSTQTVRASELLSSSAQTARKKARRTVKKRVARSRARRSTNNSANTIPRNIPVVIGNRDVDASPQSGVVGPIGPVAPTSNDNAAQSPANSNAQRRVSIAGGVLNGKAIHKFAPEYPPIAKAARAQGSVSVQITVDEEGRVIDAKAVSGHPLLQQSAVSAVRQWRFSPTLLSGQPVKVTGVVIVNYNLQ